MRADEYRFIEALRDSEERVRPSQSKFARAAMPSPHPGIAITSDGGTLEVRAADMPLRDQILPDLQPVYHRNGAIVIRLDIQQPGTINATLETPAGYYRGVLVPPTSPHNGIAITEAQFASAAHAPPGSLGNAWSSAANLQSMIEKHFGRVDCLADTPAARTMDPTLLDKIQRFADRVAAAQAVAGREQGRGLQR